MGSGAFGINLLAGLNPVRWSSTKDFKATKAELRNQKSQDLERPVILKVPAGFLSKERSYRNVREAIDALDHSCEWMWGGAPTGELATLNPFRWSTIKGVEATIEELRALTDKDAERPVLV